MQAPAFSPNRCRTMPVSRRRARLVFWSLLEVVMVLTPKIGLADDGGASFWLPGTYGSFAAVPGEPGWSAETIFYNSSVTAGNTVAVARQIETGEFSPTVHAIFSTTLRSSEDQLSFTPSYTFATPVLGGQASIGMTAMIGQSSNSVAGTLTTTSGPLTLTRSDVVSDSLRSIGDLTPEATLKWNNGVNNYMMYATGNIPTGPFDPERLSNVGLGFGAFDAGAGYTYFDQQTGHELSVVTGFTTNFENPSNHYQNGVDWHLDWGMSQSLSKQVFIGAVGYIYKQIGCDRGSGDEVGCFQSQVLGAGPQLGFIFPIGELEGTLNFKFYEEFASENRPAGMNAWLCFSISPAPTKTSEPPPIGVPR